MESEIMQRVSVVIRTKGMEKTPALIDALSKQSILPSEVIIVNNGERLGLTKAEFNIKEVEVSDREFTHMYSTNLGVSLASNEFICITNGHSLPINSKWLENGLESFQSSGRTVAAVCGHQIANNSLARRFYTGIAYFFDKCLVVSGLFLRGIVERHMSTINCIIRKSLWNIYSFDENLVKTIPETKQLGGEDYDWELEMTNRGYRIVIDYRLSVTHSHFNDLQRETKRAIKNYFVCREIRKKIKLLHD